MRHDGPIVHVVGDIESPKWSGVINSPVEGKRQGVDDRDLHRRVSSGELGPTSTLDPAYDAKRPDTSWLCVFCKRPSHFNGMGDLFGPYFVTSDGARAAAASMPSPMSAPLHSAAANAAKFILGGGDSGGKKKRKRKPSSLEGSPAKGSSDQRNTAEVWFHEDCICWMPDITLIGTRLIGKLTKVASVRHTW